MFGLELPKDQQAIVAGQRIEDRRDVRRMLGFQMALQLNEVLSMLHLFEQGVARGLLPAGERGQHAMTVEETYDFVAQLLARRTRGSRRHDSNSPSAPCGRDRAAYHRRG